MNKRDTGGPAFPFVHEIESDRHGMRAVYVEAGMTLRDYFAAKALQGLLANPNQDYAPMAQSALDSVVHDAYRVADVMLQVRGK